MNYTFQDQVQAYWFLRQFRNRCWQEPNMGQNIARSSAGVKVMSFVVKKMWVDDKEQLQREEAA